MTSIDAGADAADAVTFNPFAPDFFENPYAQYAEVREHDPVHLTMLGIQALFRYDDVVRVLRDPTLSVEQREFLPPGIDPAELEGVMGPRREGGNRAILNLDPPDHHRIRRLVAKAFTPRFVESLRPRVQVLVDHYLDVAVAETVDGTFDLISSLAFQLPFTVISEMMGIPEGRDRAELREWSGALVKTLDPIITIDEIRAAATASQNFFEYMTETIAAKRREPDDRLLSAMIAAEEDGESLTLDELIDNVMLLFIAGHETTVNLIGNGTLALLRNRAQLELLAADPSLDANAVDELLRFDSPVQISGRLAVTSFDLDGHTVEAGASVMTCLGSANRDPRQFPDPDRLDLRRDNANQHTSFGGGVHHCLGQALARLEGQAAIGTIARRFPNIELATDRVEWNGRIVLRGVKALPVSI